ncbi:MAG: sugar transferase [Gemmatimonadota bacterium]|nr:MAG: sugar transferase [Gemmatimonadota bacterium]
MNISFVRDQAAEYNSASTPTVQPLQQGLAGPRRVALPAFRRSAAAYSIAKRVLDVGVSLTAVLLGAPFMLAIAIAVKLESKGPVLFGHVRLGKNGRYFRCYKFRTMHAGAQSELLRNPELKRIYVENDFKVPLEKDPRVTRFGRFLRKSSLDELPQFFNVLGGSMSLVGPRPIVQEELAWYSDDEKAEFLSVRPGITGAWQVQGRSRIGYPARTRVELDAIREQSFWRDVRLLAISVPAVITSRGSL